MSCRTTIACLCRYTKSNTHTGNKTAISTTSWSPCFQEGAIYVYVSADTSECAYTYEEQPLTNLECNPYPNNRLILSCAVRGPNLVSIDWFWEPLNTRQPQRLPSTQNKYSLVTRFIMSQSRSQLRVQQLNDNDAGWYYCQVELSNGTLLTPSNRLFLAIQSEYVVNASTCPDRAQTTRVRSCANISIDSSTTASIVSTPPPDPITDGNRGTGDPSSSSPTDGNHHPSVLATIITLAPTPTVTSVPDSESDKMQVVLYSMAAMISIVVFCATIVTLGFFLVILTCRKQCCHVKSKKTAGKSVLGIFHSSYQTTHCLLYHRCILFVFLVADMPKPYTCSSPMIIH